MSDTVATESAPSASPVDQLLEAGEKAKEAARDAKKGEEKPATKSERKRSAVADLKDFLKSKEAEKAPKAEKSEEKPAAPKKDSADKSGDKDKSAKGATEANATSKTEAKIDLVTEAIEAEGEEAPDQRKNETDKQYELRLARTLRDLKDAKAEALSEKKARTEAEKKAGELEKRIAKAKNPETVLEALEEMGWSLESLAKGVVDKKIPIPSQRAKLPPEMQERMDALEAQSKKLQELEDKRAAELAKAEQLKAEEAKRVAAEKQRTGNVNTVKSYIDDNSDEFPFLSAAEWAAGEAVDRAVTKKTSNVKPILEEMEAQLVQNVASMLSSEKAARALLKSSPALKDALVKVLDLAPVAPVEPKAEKTKGEPKTIASKAMTSETPSNPTKGMSSAERKRWAAAELQEFMRSQKR